MSLSMSAILIEIHDIQGWKALRFWQGDQGQGKASKDRCQGICRVSIEKEREVRGETLPFFSPAFEIVQHSSMQELKLSNFSMGVA